MLSMENCKYYIFITIITIILGYFMGITISTIVDYRLKDAVINLPKPKNKILVKLDKGKILETFSSSKKSKTKKKKQPKKNDSKNKKKSTTKKIKNNEKSSNKRKEGMNPSLNQYTYRALSSLLRFQGKLHKICCF